MPLHQLVKVHLELALKPCSLLFLWGYWSRTSYCWWEITLFLISRVKLFIAGPCISSSQRTYINVWLFCFFFNSSFVIILNYKSYFLPLFAYLDCYLKIFTLQAVLVSCDWSVKLYDVVSYSWFNKQTYICENGALSFLNICIYMTWKFGGVLNLHCCTTQLFKCS